MRRIAIASALTLAAALAVGCGGSGGSGPSSVFAVVVVSSSPTAGAAGVPVQPAEVRVRFSHDLNAATVIPANVRLEDLGAGSAVVPGNVSYTAATREVVWTMTQTDLNALLPGAVAFDFDHPYQLVITQGVKSDLGPEISQTVTVTFRTQLAQLGIASSDPQAATTTALIEPYTVFLPNNATMSSIVTVVLDANVDPVSVTNTALVRLEDTTGGVPVSLTDQKLTYDPATRTLGWTMTAPQTGALNNTTFTAEPVLRFDTPYRLTIDATVPILVTGTSYISAAPLTLDFRTAKFVGAPVNPSPATASAQVLINEVYADVDINGPAASDANKDGNWDEASDEFVEVINLTDDYIDLTEHVLTDVSGGGTESAYLTFPGTAGAPDIRALLPPRRAVVYFGNILGTADERALGLDRSKFLAGTRTQGKLNNSGGDRLRLYAPVQAFLLSDLDFKVASPPADQSVNRNPDGTAGNNNWAGHTSVSPSNAVQSAGIRADGTPFK